MSRASNVAAALAPVLAIAFATSRASAQPQPPVGTHAEPAETPPRSPEPPRPEPTPDPSTTPIPPEAPPGVTPAPGSPADPSTNEADKRIGVGIDLVFIIPLGAFDRQTGLPIGPVVRFGYRVLPPLEVSMRAGYLFALAKDQQAGVVAKLDILPVWLSVRYFLLRPFVGPYVAADVGANLYLPAVEPPPPGAAGDMVTEGRWRFGANFGAGYVVSDSLPIDFRAQLVLPNLVGKDSNLGEKTHVGIGGGVGYTLQF